MGTRTRKTTVVPPGAGPLTIGALSRATRIPVETLRTWERRYGAPMPIRKPSGHRLYPPESVDHLRAVSRLLERGHRPQEIVGLDRRRLDALLAYSGAGAAEAAAPVALAASPAEPSVEGSIEAMLRAARRLEREPILRELRAGWVRLGPVRFLDQCAGPFMTRVGEAWKEGALEIREEHFASACLSDFLRELREPFDERAAGARVVAATLPGELHEVGVLMAALALAVRGHRVVYLGASTPVDQIAETVRRGAAEAVAVSVSTATPRPRAAREIAQLRRLLPRRVPLWVGGAGAPEPARGFDRFATCAEFDAWLAAR